VELRVEDTGPGIPEHIMERLFEPYVTTKPRGTGLGLAIVKRIVEEHGGWIWAENPATGGTAIVVRLPVLERGIQRQGEL
jgi:signal transduction histidine kinase